LPPLCGKRSIIIQKENPCKSSLTFYVAMLVTFRLQIH